MFADDLILVTRASQRAVWNYLMCLNIYENFTEQRVNLSNSTVHIPFRCNARIVGAISIILGFKIGKFPLNYFGFENTPRKLSVK